MTRKKFDLSKYIGGIKRNSTGHVVAAEATTLLFGIKFNPKLNAKEGRLVGIVTLLCYEWSEIKTLLKSLQNAQPLFYVRLLSLSI